MTLLRAKDLKPAELRGLLADLTFPEDQPARGWLEAADGWSLDYWRGLGGKLRWYGAGRLPMEAEAAELLPRVLEGRIFTRAGELRWRYLPALGEQSCRTVYLGEYLPPTALLDERHELAGLQRTEVEVPLWGRLTAASRAGAVPQAWVELRIPQRFHYPVPVPADSSRDWGVKAVVETWSDNRGELHFTRFVDLQSYSGD
jgi:hypothetical protein